MTEVVVAGGGLAGLVAARRLAAAGADVTLFERAEEPGGRVTSRRRDGYVLDRGFQVLFTGYPAVQRELDADALDLRYFESGATLARPGDRTVLRDPRRHPTGSLETLLNPDLSLRDALALLRVVLGIRGRSWDEIGSRGGTSTATRLADAGLSQSFVETVAAPFFGGITLDRSLATDGLVFEYATKALLDGRAAVPATGMGAIARQLAERAREAGVETETGRGVTAVDARNSGADGEATVEVGGETHSADAVVVATDPPTAADLTGVDAIPTAGRGCVTQYVSLPSGSAPELDPRLVLSAADPASRSESDGIGRLAHVAPLSATAPEYAPDDRELYAATFLDEGLVPDPEDCDAAATDDATDGPGATDDATDGPGATDEELFERVRKTLAAWYPEARFGELSLVATDRIPFAQFRQDPGFRADLPAIDAPEGPVFLAGEYTHWSSIQGALESGRVAAETATAALSG